MLTKHIKPGPSTVSPIQKPPLHGRKTREDDGSGATIQRKGDARQGYNANERLPKRVYTSDRGSMISLVCVIVFIVALGLWWLMGGEGKCLGCCPKVHQALGFSDPSVKDVEIDGQSEAQRCRGVV